MRAPCWRFSSEFGSFCNYLWNFSGGKVVLNPNEGFRTTSPLSDRITADMKRRGMKYAGSVTIYSFLQAAGIVNDHEQTCFRYQAIDGQRPERTAFYTSSHFHDNETKHKARTGESS